MSGHRDASSALESALVGCFGGLFATFCVYPLDLVKSRVSGHVKSAGDADDTTWRDVLRGIVREKGLAGLYEGMGGRAAQCFVEDFVFFWWFASVKSAVAARVKRREGRARPLTILESLLAGAVAGVINNACTIPFDVVATNRQIASASTSRESTTSASRAYLDTIRDVRAKGGLRAFWSGMAPSCLLVVNPAVNFAAFDRLKTTYNRAKARAGARGRSRVAMSDIEAATTPLGPLEAFLIGAASKAIATTITFPLIRAKVLMMRRAGSSRDRDSGSRSKANAKSRAREDEDEDEDGDVRAQANAFFEVWGDIVRAEGVAGLYRGLGVQLSRSAVAAAIMFATRERLDAATAGTIRRLRRAAETAKTV